jgi:hypothetical protein
MPVRHEDDFRRKYIKSWDSWIEETIREAQDRGDFDDLPDHGKPIRLEDSPFAPEMASALRTLKNAGYQPTWMELDKEITRDKRELETFLDRSCEYLSDRIAELATPDLPEPSSASDDAGFWARIRLWLLHGDGGVAGAARLPPLTHADVVAMRYRMREQYLERAARIDKKIQSFHAALPRNLWHLERMRLTQDAAAKTFDERCPAIR